MSQARKDSLRRWAAVGGGLVVAASFLAPAPAQAEKLAAKTERPAFDLTYVPADAVGVIAVRPNCIFSDPAMRPLAKMANEALRGLLPGLCSANPKFSLEEIEQLVVPISITPSQGDLSGTNAIGMAPLMIRSAYDFDWQKLMRCIDPKMKEVRHQGQRIYNVALRRPSKGGPGIIIRCAFPDKRTLILIPEPIGQRPRFSWDKQWKQVENCLFAIAFDNRWTQALNAEQIEVKPEWNELIHHASAMVAGLDWKDGIDFRAFLICKDPEAAKQALQDVKNLVARIAPLWEGIIEEDSEAEPITIGPTFTGGPVTRIDSPFAAGLPVTIGSSAITPQSVWMLRVVKDFVENARVTRHASTISAHATVKFNLIDGVKLVTAIIEGSKVMAAGKQDQ